MEAMTKKPNIINDMRGSLYSANQLEIRNNKVYYCGYPVSDLQKSKELIFSDFTYNVISGNEHKMILGQICLTDDDAKKALDIIKFEPVEFTRINNDTCGNPRFVCHFLAFIHPDEPFTDIENRYTMALKRSRELGGRKFHNKQYGGGIVFQMYDGQVNEMSKRIYEIRDRFANK